MARGKPGAGIVRMPHSLLQTVHSCITTTSARRAGIRLWRVTSIGTAEGYAAHITFQRAGVNVAIHWQDADSSSAKAVREIFPKAKIMLCGRHAGRAHRKILEKRQKDKV